MNRLLKFFQVLCINLVLPCAWALNMGMPQQQQGSGQGEIATDAKAKQCMLTFGSDFWHQMRNSKRFFLKVNEDKIKQSEMWRNSITLAFDKSMGAIIQQLKGKCKQNSGQANAGSGSSGPSSATEDGASSFTDGSASLATARTGGGSSATATKGRSDPTDDDEEEADDGKSLSGGDTGDDVNSGNKSRKGVGGDSTKQAADAAAMGGSCVSKVMEVARKYLDEGNRKLLEAKKCITLAIMSSEYKGAVNGSKQSFLGMFALMPGGASMMFGASGATDTSGSAGAGMMGGLGGNPMMMMGMMGMMGGSGLKCTSNLHTQDWAACSGMLTALDTAVIADQGLSTYEKIDQAQHKSQTQRDLIANEGKDLVKPFEAMQQNAEKQKEIKMIRAAFQAGKLATFLKFYRDFPTPDELLEHTEPILESSGGFGSDMYYELADHVFKKTCEAMQTLSIKEGRVMCPGMSPGGIDTSEQGSGSESNPTEGTVDDSFGSGSGLGESLQVYLWKIFWMEAYASNYGAGAGSAVAGRNRYDGDPNQIGQIEAIFTNFEKVQETNSLFTDLKAKVLGTINAQSPAAIELAQEVLQENMDMLLPNQGVRPLIQQVMGLAGVDLAKEAGAAAIYADQANKIGDSIAKIKQNLGAKTYDDVVMPEDELLLKQCETNPTLPHCPKSDNTNTYDFASAGSVNIDSAPNLASEGFITGQSDLDQAVSDLDGNSDINSVGDGSGSNSFMSNNTGSRDFEGMGAPASSIKTNPGGGDGGGGGGGGGGGSAQTLTPDSNANKNAKVDNTPTSSNVGYGKGGLSNPNRINMGDGTGRNAAANAPVDNPFANLFGKKGGPDSGIHNFSGGIGDANSIGLFERISERYQTKLQQDSLLMYNTK